MYLGVTIVNPSIYPSYIDRSLGLVKLSMDTPCLKVSIYLSIHLSMYLTLYVYVSMHLQELCIRYAELSPSLTQLGIYLSINLFSLTI
jgi:hypothetical protein